MQRLLKDSTVRVAIVDKWAYWIQNNQVFKSDFDNDGQINLDTAVPVDVFSLNDKETKKLLDIIDSLSD